MNASFYKSNLDKLPEGTSLVEQGHILKDWFIFRDSRHFGPLSSKQIRGFLSKKLISTNHYIWRPGFDGWTSINEVEGFKSYGKGSIRSYTDGEFSNKAKLNYIDRITQEAHSLDFKEGEAFVEIERNIFETLLFNLRIYFGFNDEYINYGRLMGSLITLCVVGAMIYNAQSVNYKAELIKLPQEVRETFINIAAETENLRNPKFTLFETQRGLGDPLFMGATNLPKGTRLRMEITGVQGTLAGSYRFSKNETFAVDHKIFQTEAVRKISGGFIPAGKYMVQTVCLDCADTNQVIYRKEHFLSSKDPVTYEKDLQNFVDSSRENIRLELDELEDLSYTLFSQYKATSDRFIKSSGSSKRAKWQGFSAQWLSKQNKLVELFQQIKADEFSQNLYYLGLYEGYAKIVKQIFELHMAQDNILSSKTKDMTSLHPIVQQIDVNLKALKAQVELARVRFSQGGGFPVIENLNI